MEPQISTLTGSFNEMFVPTLLVETVEGECFKVIVDTGFNGYLWMTELQAALLHIQPISSVSIAVTAGDIGVEFWTGSLAVRWFDKIRTVYPSVYPSSKRRRHPRLEPTILLGNLFLHPDNLAIDFYNKVVNITRHTS